MFWIVLSGWPGGSLGAGLLLWSAVHSTFPRASVDQANGRAPARIEVSPARIDFGERGHLENPATRVTLKNTGGTRLEISSIRPSCSCIDVRPETLGAIEAGGSQTLEISMGSGRAMGRLHKTVALTTSDPRRPSVTIPVQMSVHDGFAVDPLQIRFQGAVGGESVVRYARLTRRDGRSFDFEIVGFSDLLRLPSQKYLDAESRDIPGGKRIRFTLDPGHPEGRIGARFLARLDGRAFVLPITGEMFAGILVDPTFVNFSRARPQDEATLSREVLLSSVDGTPFAIEDIRQEEGRRPNGKPPELRFEVHSAPSRQRHRLVVRLKPPSDPKPNASFFGRILIRTSHPKKAELKLTFSGFFVK